VTVVFADGHKVIFTKNSGSRKSYCVERTCLEFGDEIVAMFHSKHQEPVNRRPFGLQKLAPGYTIKDLVQYLWSAFEYILANHRSTPGLFPAQAIVCWVHKDIEELSRGEWPAP